jgi:hypothetical protein
MTSLFPDPLKRDEIIDSETGKIKNSLLPTSSSTAVDTSFDPTGTEYAPESTNLSLTSIEAINRIKTLEDASGRGVVAKISSYLDYAELPASLTNTNKTLAALFDGCLNVDGTTNAEGNYKVKGTVYLNMSQADAVTIGVYKYTTEDPTWTLISDTSGTHGNNTYGRFINEITENVGTGKHKVELETVVEGLVTGDIIGMFVKGTTTTANAIIGRTFFYEKTNANYYKTAINWDI